MDRAWLNRCLVGLVSTALGLSLAACGGGDEETEATPTPTPTVEAVVPTEATENSLSASPSDEETEEQPVSEEMIQRLIEVANDAGYGPADEGFALLMVDVCRDVESGHSEWSELIAQDVADGAPRADARRFNGFLRDEFCPEVKPLNEDAQPSGDAEAVGDGTRGLGSSASFLDAQWKHGSVKDCRAATGSPIGEARAYRRAGALVCGSYIDGGPWGDTFINLDVVFDPNVTEARARKMALRLLPADATFETRLKNSNPEWAAKGGSCVSLIFRSSTLSDAILAANPDWSDPDGATATMYSLKQTDYGSGSQFDGTVRVLSISVGGDSDDPSC